MTFIQPLDTPPTGAVEKAAGTLGHGAARLSIAQREGRSFLDERYFTDPYRIFTPRTAPNEPVSVVLSTLSGGLVGGDRLTFSGHVKSDAAAQFVGQAAEKIYGSAGPTTNVTFDLSAEAGAWLEQVPQETILFNEAKLDRHFNIALHPDARALIGDMVVLGRLAMGERFELGAFSDTWKLTLGDRLVWCDRTGFEGAGILKAKGNTFGLDGAQAFATVLYVGDDAAKVVDLIRAGGIEDRAAAMGIRIGTTHLGTHSLVRLMGPVPQQVRTLLGEIWKQLRSEIGGYAPRLPTLWSI